MKFDFSISAWILMLAGIVLSVSIFLSYRQWTSDGRKKSFIFLEILRIFIICMIAFTLLKPEFVTYLKLTKTPEIQIIFDSSESMSTRDSFEKGAEKPESRVQSMKKMIDSKFYSQLEKKNKVLLKSFGHDPDTKGEGTDINKALNEALDSGTNLKAVILMTDGDWNCGESPSASAMQYRARGIPVHTIVFGSETYLPDIELKNVKAPSFCIIKEKVSIPFEVFNKTAHEINTTVFLSSSGKTETEKNISVQPFSTASGSLVWQTEKEGKVKLTMKVPEIPEEKDKENNSRTFDISVREEKLKVLILETLPRWEYRYLKNALSRDPGIEFNTLLYHPQIGMGHGKNFLDKFPSKNDLASYDVFFLGDIGTAPDQLGKENLENIRDVVKHLGSGIVFMPGIKGFELGLMESPLSEALPVDFDKSKPQGCPLPKESKPILSSEGIRHFLTILSENPEKNSAVWKELPGFFWSSAVLSARPGSTVLAVHPEIRNDSGRMPLLAIREYGNGNALFLGIDSAWRWRKGVEDKYHYRFWGQVIRWMSHKRHLANSKGIRLFYSPEKPVAGQTVFITASVFNQSQMPVNNAELLFSLKDSSGNEVQKFVLFPDDSGWGVYKGQFILRKGGDYSMMAEYVDGGISLRTDFHVSEDKLEKSGEPSNVSAMKEISTITKGGYSCGEFDIDKIIKKILTAPESTEIEKRFPLWCTWWWGFLILSLMAIYWTGRKISGLI